MTVSGGGEDIADGGTLREGSIRHNVVYVTVALVGESDEHGSSGEGVEIILNILLYLLVVPGGNGLPSSVDLSKELVDFSRRVHAVPEGLSVVGVVSSSEALFRSVVGEWHSLRKNSKSEGRFENSMVTVPIQESRVVVVVDEDSKGSDVLHGTLLLSIPIPDSIHALGVLEDISYGEVHRVVEKSSEVLSVGAYIVGVPVEALSHLEDSCALSELFPELPLYFRDGVDPDSVKVKLLHEVVDPILKILSDVLVVLV